MIDISKEKPFVSIIIVNYNGKRFLKDCFSSLLDCTYFPNFEIIFVDNASSDESVNFVKSFAEKGNITIIENIENLGFGPANNVGFEKAIGDYVVFLNNDTIVEPEWLDVLVSAVERDETVGLASPIVLNLDGRTIQSAGILKCGFFAPSIWFRIGRKFSEESFPDIFEVSSAIGAVMIAKRDFLKKIGVFDPRYFYYYDDDYLSFRTWMSGKRVVVVSKSRVRHVLGGTSRNNELFKYHYSFIGTASIIICFYNSLIHLFKFLISFTLRRFIDSTSANMTIRMRGSLTGLLWLIRNFRYVWNNRVRYWSEAKIDEKSLKTKMIKVNIPASKYLIPNLAEIQFKKESDKFLKKLANCS